jgi:hypothetical protein
MLIDARTVAADAAFTCDLCVVGAGPAGIAIAHRLRASRLSVFRPAKPGVAIDAARRPGRTADSPRLASEADRPGLHQPDEDLPGTGLSLEWECLLSSAFIRGRDYGTRCSTVIRIDQRGKVYFDEWTWDASGAQSGRASFQFEIPNLNQEISNFNQ